MAQTRLKSGNLHMVGGDNGSDGNVLKSKGDGTMEWGIAINPPTFSSFDYPGDDTALDPAGGQSLVINGGTFNIGVTVTIGGTTPSSITRNSATQLTVTTPAKSAGSQALVITNTDGGSANTNVSYNGIPSFTHNAGSLGSVESGATINVSVVATEPDGGTVTHAVTSGSLPSGASLNASTGAITGTAGTVSASTTSNFTITATDNENQSTARAYSITVTPKLPSDNFNIKLYTGNGSAQSLTGVGFKPDIIWVKQRNDTNPFAVYDSSRGAGKLIRFDNYEAESGNSGNLLASFDADGFSVNRNYLTHTAYDTTNHNNSTYSAMCWKVNGGTTSTNTLGEINSTVQVNDGAGVSIVQFAGIADPGEFRSFGHGLSAAPDIIIMKRREANQHPAVFAKINGGWEYFDGMTSTDWGGDYDSGITVTSTLIDIQDHAEWFADAGHNYVYWCWRSVAGYSKINSYTGNGSSSGPIVQTDFEPAFLMIKNASDTGDWIIFDNKRNTANPRNNRFTVNVSAAESTGSTTRVVDFLSNGFIIKSTHQDINANNDTYIYMAFAADPDTTTPTLADSFGTVAYTGDGNSSRVVTGLDFKPNLIWNKQYNGSTNHVLTDSVTGLNKYLTPSNSNAASSSTYYSSFNSNGWTMGNNHLNANSNESFINWAWKANGGVPTFNTTGSINSIVSANANAGFSISNFTGTGSAGTVAHGLSSTPEFVIIKNVSNAGSWLTWHKNYGGGDKYIYLDNSNAVATQSQFFNSTAPTSSVFSVGNHGDINGNGHHVTAYCFHSVSGYSKIDEYTGSGSGSTQAVATGFQPDWVLIKDYIGGGSWWIQDSVRGDDKWLKANNTNAQTTVSYIDFTSTGFNVTGGLNDNSVNSKFIYMAFKIN